MKASEKALQLYQKFGILGMYQRQTGYEKLAKECALVCVEEIQKAINFDWMEIQNLDREHAYWESVKNQIELI